MRQTETRANRIQKTIVLDIESAAIVAHVQSTQNLSFNAAVKYCVKRHKIKQYEPGEKVSLVKLLSMLGTLKHTLQDVTHSGGENCALLLEEIRDLLIEIRNAIFRRLGRKP
ncbi:MAG: hypothetical protein ABJN40_01685 [Sneathiella sp.]